MTLYAVSINVHTGWNAMSNMNTRYSKYAPLLCFYFSTLWLNIHSLLLFLFCFSTLQLISNSLHRLVPTFDGNLSLVHRIAAIHVAFRENSECIHWFGQLTSLSPGILESLLQSEQLPAEKEDFMVCVYQLL